MFQEAERNGDLLFNGHRISVLEDEKVVGMDGGDGCTTVCTDLMPVNSTLKNGPRARSPVGGVREATTH